MIECISSYRALSQGANLWALPFEPKDFWFKKINWRLRFLLCPPLANRPPDYPVLASVEGVFPAQQILCLPKNEKNWVIACHQNWKKLGQPSLRVFLPQDMESDIFCAKWPEEKIQDILSCVRACSLGEDSSKRSLSL